jgi:hypothetical protein
VQAPVAQGTDGNDRHESLEHTLSTSDSCAACSKRASDASHGAGSSQRRSAVSTPRASGHDAPTHSDAVHSQLGALQTALQALLPKLPLAVTGDERCQPLKDALAELQRALMGTAGGRESLVSPGAQAALLAAAHAAIDVVVDALASFASDLRTAHLCRVEAEAARQAAEAAAGEAQHAANSYRAKRDDAARYGQEKAEALRKERAICAELKQQLQHFSTVLSAATDHVESLHGGGSVAASGRTLRAASQVGRR